MDRLRTRPHALQGIELAVEAQRTLVAPDQSHNLYRFFDGADGLAGAPSRATHAGHGVPKSPGAKPDLHPPCREHVEAGGCLREHGRRTERDRKSTRLNSSHANISYAVFCLKKKKKT